MVTWDEHCAGQAGYRGAADKAEKPPVETKTPGIDDLSPAALKKELEDRNIEPATGTGSTDKNRDLLREAVSAAE